MLGLFKMQEVTLATFTLVVAALTLSGIVVYLTILNGKCCDFCFQTFDSGLTNIISMDFGPPLLPNLTLIRRFDGVTAMILMNKAVGDLPSDYPGTSISLTRRRIYFPGYFGPAIDVDALRYLTLANDMLHETYPFIITIAEGS